MYEVPTNHEDACDHDEVMKLILGSISNDLKMYVDTKKGAYYSFNRLKSAVIKLIPVTDLTELKFDGTDPTVAQFLTKYE